MSNSRGMGKSKIMVRYSRVMRANILEKELMLTCGEGRRTRWMEEIHTISGMDLAELRDAVEDRVLWRRMTNDHDGH